jgi:hypothetical protein
MNSPLSGQERQAAKRHFGEAYQPNGELKLQKKGSKTKYKMIGRPWPITDKICGLTV